MRTRLGALVWALVVGTVALAGDSPVSTWNQTNTDGSIESFWVVSFPSGSSDFFNSRHDGLALRPIRGVSVASADFGSGRSYPLAGLYDANLTVDPSGNTPDLNAGIGVPIPGGGTVYNWVYGGFGVTYVPASEPQHVVCQFPPGDSATLAIGNDDDTTTLFSGWTQDGFTTPAYGGYNFGLNANIDVSQELVGSDGVLGLYRVLTDETGDFTSVTLQAGDPLGVAFFAPFAGSVWMLWQRPSTGPSYAVGPPMPTLPDGPYAYARVGGSWPAGFGGLTLNYFAVSGVQGVIGTVGVSNDITVYALPEQPEPWGSWDDCTYEAGWVIPPGFADYINANFNNPLAPKPNDITGIGLAVLDFGTTITAFPMSGAFAANYTVDPTGNTPDLAHPYDAAPHTFPPGIFATTCQQMSVRVFAAPIPYSSVLSDDVHGVFQWPTGDTGWLGIAADTTPPHHDKYFGSNDGYRTPAFPIGGDWGLRLTSQ
ncbi:MAG: hypothetical protein AB1486_29425 [Planctomycetota bacterium]